MGEKKSSATACTENVIYVDTKDQCSWNYDKIINHKLWCYKGNKRVSNEGRYVLWALES